MLAVSRSPRALLAAATKPLTIVAVPSESALSAFASNGACPSNSGSVALTSSPRPGPCINSTKRCSLTGRTEMSAPGSSIRSNRLMRGAAGFGSDPSRAPVQHQSTAVQRTEVPPRGNVTVTQLHPYAQRFQDATSDGVLDGVVAQEGQVSGPAAGRDARGHRGCQAAGASLRQTVQVRKTGRFQLRPARIWVRETSKPVDDQQHYLGRRRLAQLSYVRQVDHYRASVRPSKILSERENRNANMLIGFTLPHTDLVHVFEHIMCKEQCAWTYAHTAVGVLSISSATPGSVVPSRNPRVAPPPVET